MSRRYAVMNAEPATTPSPVITSEFRRCGGRSKWSVRRHRRTSASKPSTKATHQVGPLPFIRYVNQSVSRIAKQFNLGTVCFGENSSSGRHDHQRHLFVGGAVTSSVRPALHLHVFALFTGEVRSCSPAENAQQARHSLGCGRTSLSETVFCLCDTDLCNNSPSLGSASLFLPICLLLSTTANLSL